MEKNKRYQWHKIANDKSEFIFPLSGLLQIQVGKKQVCIAQVNGNLFGCASNCPHAGGVIADGYIDALNNIVCPVHRYKFNLQNGRNVSGEGYYLKIYPIRETDEGVYIGIEQSGLNFW